MSVHGEIRESGKYLIEWSIKDFFLLPIEDGAFYDSPQFFVVDEPWFLKIYQNGNKIDNSEGFIDLYLLRKCYGPPIRMEFTLGVKTVDEKIDPERHFTECFVFIDCHSAPKLLSRSELLGRKSVLLPSDTLTLVCRIISLQFTEFKSTSISCVALPKSKILQDMKQLFLKKENCDVVFRVENQEIHAHQAILSARSPILASTFRYDTKEKITGIVDIKDFDPHSFSDFLGFLYCEDIDLSEKNIFSLFAAADKYDVTDLRQKCIEFIKSNLSIDTFCDSMTLALLHTEPKLIRFITNFYIKNEDDIIETVQWQSFINDNPTLRDEFFKLLAYNQKQKGESLNS